MANIAVNARSGHRKRLLSVSVLVVRQMRPRVLQVLHTWALLEHLMLQRRHHAVKDENWMDVQLRKVLELLRNYPEQPRRTAAQRIRIRILEHLNTAQPASRIQSDPHSTKTLNLRVVDEQLVLDGCFVGDGGGSHTCKCVCSCRTLIEI